MPPVRWQTLSDDALLKVRLKDLRVRFEGTWLEQCLDNLYSELEQRGIRLKPHAWISDEWFSVPKDTPGIAIPFYLTHPRLMRLERKMVLEVEGGTVRECMRILRHEAGHVIQQLYQLQRRRRWQQLFGKSSAKYPRHYEPNPRSKNYVQHLRLWYAQSHPDEDFAETFAVWLSPRSAWRKRYVGWPALKKLEYMDELMTEVADMKPRPMRRLRIDPISRLGETLAQHYERKRAYYRADFPRTYDRDLHRIFSADPADRKAPTAASFIRDNRAKLRPLISKWTGEYQLTLDAVIDRMIARCRELRLRAPGRKSDLFINFSVLLTAQIAQLLYHRQRRERIAL
ncbi:MAG: putative zinc-binding metallopeptidase [Rhodospirillaceae bacterium]